MFSQSPLSFITVYSKLVGDLFHADSTLVESEFIRRKTRPKELPRDIIVIISKPVNVGLF